MSREGKAFLLAIKCFHHLCLVFQGHGEDRDLIGGTSGQDPQQRAGNVVPHATNTRQDGSCLNPRDRNSKHALDFFILVFKKIHLPHPCTLNYILEMNEWKNKQTNKQKRTNKKRFQRNDTALFVNNIIPAHRESKRIVPCCTDALEIIQGSFPTVPSFQQHYEGVSFLLVLFCVSM